MTAAGEQFEVDPEALRAAAAGWDNRLHAAALGAMMLLAAVYPLLLAWLVTVVGRPAVALGLAVAGATSTARSLAAGNRAAAAAAAIAAALALAAAWSDSVRPLLAIPALIYAGVAVLFLASLHDEVSLVERGARLIQPVAPPFIGPYCRGVTLMWGAVLLAAAAVLAVLAAAASVETWRSVAGAGLWAAIAAISAGEFLVRKTYFRNYWYRGPFERVWSRLFPAEATPMGRRSAAYIRTVREKLEKAAKAP